MNLAIIRKTFLAVLVLIFATGFSVSAGASERRNFNAKQEAAVRSAIDLIGMVGFIAHAKNLLQMLDSDITHADGSSSGLKQIHMDTDTAYTAKGTTTAYQGSGGQITGAIRLNDDLVKSGSQIELAATLVHEKTHVMRLEKENNLKAWNMGAIYDTVNDYIRSNGGDKDLARQNLVDDLQNEENKDPQDAEKIKHLEAVLNLLDGGPYTNWIEIEAYYTELKFLLTAVREGFAEYEYVKDLIESVISNCEKHEGGMETGIRSHFTAIDSDPSTSDTDKVDQKIQVLHNQLAGVDGNITAMATHYTNMVGDPAQMDIDSTGGTLSLTLPGNTSGVADIGVNIPPGALAGSRTFKIDEQTEYLLAGWIWIYTPASKGYFVHPDALMFAEETAPTITLRYFEGKNHPDLDIYQLSLEKPNDGRWQKIDTDRTVNETNQTISVTTTQLGVFAILEATPWLKASLTGTASSSTGTGQISIVVSAPEGATLKNETPLSDTDPNLNLAGKPADTPFPHGLIFFTVEDLAAGESVTVFLTYPDTLPEDVAYYFVDDEGFHVLAEADISGNTVILEIIDGGNTDSDGAADGIITIRGGPAGPPPDDDNGSENTGNGSGNGGGCFIPVLRN